MVATILTRLMGATVALALMVIALWGWGESRALVAKADNPQLALWAVRCAALSALAGAQVLALTFVVSVFYRHRDRVDDLARLAAGFACTAALIGAIALGLISR